MAVETANGRENRFGREKGIKMTLSLAMVGLMKNALCIYVSHCSMLLAGAFSVAGKRYFRGLKHRSQKLSFEVHLIIDAHCIYGSVCVCVEHI